MLEGREKRIETFLLVSSSTSYRSGDSELRLNLVLLIERRDQNGQIADAGGVEGVQARSGVSDALEALARSGRVNRKFQEAACDCTAPGPQTEEVVLVSQRLSWQMIDHRSTTYFGQVPVAFDDQDITEVQAGTKKLSVTDADLLQRAQIY